jgi:type I restriction enzyme, R subunit
MATGTKELHLEEHIEQHLVANSGYLALHTSLYEKELCLVPEELIAFIQSTQPDVYAALQEHYGTQTDERIVNNISKNITKFGTLHVLLEGVKDSGQKIRLTYFKPASGMNTEHQALLWPKQSMTILPLSVYKERDNMGDRDVMRRSIKDAFIAQENMSKVLKCFSYMSAEVTSILN